MEKYNYDISHYSFANGRMGRLMTLSNILVVAGDVIDVRLSGLFRLSPLRRNLTMDAMVDICAFFVPHRHVYGNDWVEFIKQGVDETVTLGTADAGTEGVWCVGRPSLTGTVAKHILYPYNMIYNRYFVDPADPALQLSNDQFATENMNTCHWGQRCCYLPNMWSTGVLENNVTEADHRVALVDTDKIDILELAQARGRLYSERKKDFEGLRYTDWMKEIYGSHVNIDADQRPELVMRNSFWLSGYDVDGTDATSLGQYSGKSVKEARFSFPPKLFIEHGSLMIMALVRFPAMHVDEMQYLDKKSEPTYKEIAGDPNIIMNEPPIAIKPAELFNGNVQMGDIGLFPYAQWYRTQPSFIHANLKAQNGFPFKNLEIAGNTDAKLEKDGDNDQMFISSQYGHWQSQCYLAVNRNSVVPSGGYSIYAGVK